MVYTPVCFLPGFDTAYMYGEVPFTDLCYNPLQHLSWWQARAMDSNANVLSVCYFALRVLLVYQIRTRLFPWARSIKFSTIF